MKKILITGVTGFVGSTLVRAFMNHPGIQVIGQSRQPAVAAEKFPGVAIRFISTCPTEQINEFEIDCIIHLAGIAHDLSNRYKEADYYKVNFEHTARLYDDFLKSNATKFIYVSSIKAAVDAVREPLTEQIKPNPVTAYGKSKLMAEEYIAAHAKTNKQYYILRPCMIHGPGNKGNLNLLYKFVRSGIPYPLGSFHNKRSFLGSDNLAFIMEKLILNSIESGIYNVADKGSLSTTEVVRNIAEALERRATVWNVPAGPIKFFASLIGKKGMLDKLTESMEVSNNKILDALKTSLPVSIEEGLRKTILSFNE